MTLSAVELGRFWSWVEKTETCWLWRGNRGRYGHGRFKLRGKLHSPHRLAWQVLVGPIPRGKDVRATCDQAGCIRPEHHELMTRRTGARFSRKDLHRPNAKLTEEQVAEIARRYQAGGVTQRALALQYGVDRTTVSALVRRVNWRKCLPGCLPATSGGDFEVA